VGHVVIETFLVLNGIEINDLADEQGRIVLAIAENTQRDYFAIFDRTEQIQGGAKIFNTLSITPFLLNRSLR